MVDQLNEEQISALKDAFAMFDTTNCGTITTQEAGIVIKNLRTNTAESSDSFQELDDDNALLSIM